MNAASGVSISVEEPSKELRDEIVRNVVAFNDSVGSASNHEELAIVARKDGSLVAGVSGATYFEWLFVSHLWVDEAFRGTGLGTTILQSAEREALRRGCGAVWLDTFSFQVKPFYEKLGYRQFGELADYPPGFTRFFLWKPLLK